ncbi:hypothetical protein ZEAMMB73_Zm00001d029109, partial [Zea mays]
MGALTMWLLHPSSHLHPPLSCPHTTPASFRRPGFLLGMKPLGYEYKEKRGLFSSNLG